MTKGVLESWIDLKEKIISLKRISESWFILKIEVEYIAEEFTKASPSLGQISTLTSNNEQIIEVLEKAVDSFRDCQGKKQVLEEKWNHFRMIRFNILNDSGEIDEIPDSFSPLMKAHWEAEEWRKKYTNLVAIITRIDCRV